MKEKLHIVPIPLQKSKIKKFVHFSQAVYKNYPKWVAPIFSDQTKFILKGPFHEIGEVQLFMAYRGSLPVARLSAHINKIHNEYYKVNQGFFGFFEAYEDQEAVELIFQEAGQWLSKKGCKSMLGPESFAIYDEIGILMDNYQISPVLMCSYNPPYYPTLLENIGFKKEIDWYAYYKSSYKPITRSMERIAQRMYQRQNLQLRYVNLKDWDNEVKLVRHIFEDAWAENWGHLPFTDKQWKHLVSELKLIIKEKLTHILEMDGKPIAFSISVPNAYEALIKAKGRLFPFGIFKILRQLKHINMIRTIVLGVLKEYRNRGYELGMIQKIITEGLEMGYHAADCSLIVETNTRLIKGLEAIGAKKYKTFRLYKKIINSD